MLDGRCRFICQPGISVGEGLPAFPGEFLINVPVKLLELEALFYTRFRLFFRCFIRLGWANLFLDETISDQYDFLAGCDALQSLIDKPFQLT